MEMYDPPHPGLVLREYIGNKSIKEVAQRLDIERNTLLRILHGKENITAEIAVRLSILLGTSSKMWLGMQEDYDLWQAKQRHNYDSVIPLSQPLLATA